MSSSRGLHTLQSDQGELGPEQISRFVSETHFIGYDNFHLLKSVPQQLEALPKLWFPHAANVSAFLTPEQLEDRIFENLFRMRRIVAVMNDEIVDAPAGQIGALEDKGFEIFDPVGKQLQAFRAHRSGVFQAAPVYDE